VDNASFLNGKYAQLEAASKEMFKAVVKGYLVAHRKKVVA
jgi:hypothetical protein